MDFLSTNGFPARWFCGSGWTDNPWLGWLHILSDLLTFLAYYAVPAVTIYYVYRQKSVKLPPIFYFFLAGIFLTCGTVHLLEAIIFWWPIYPLAGFVKLLTALVSCVGVVVLARVLPSALELKSGREYQRVVSEREQTQATLEHERFLLRTLLDHLPDAIYFKDAEGRFMRISHSMALRMGCQSDSAVQGKSDSDYFSPQFTEKIRADELELMRTGTPIIGKEEYIQWPANGAAWVLTTKIPLRSEDGRTIGICGISHDVSDIKAKEQALRASEERFMLAVKGSSDGLWDWDTSTDHVYYSPRFLELIGYNESEFPPNLDSFRKHLHPEDVASTFAAVDAHLKRNEPYDAEYRLLTKAGEYRWFRARGEAIRNEAGQATRMAGSISDITDRHQADELLRLVIATSPTALIMVNRAHKLTLVNTHAAQVFGYDADELLGQDVQVLVPEKFRERHGEYVDQFFARPASRGMAAGRKLFGRKKDGTEFPVEIAISQLRNEDGIFVIAGIVDITESQQALQQISRAKEAAEASNRAKSDFLANMSHEIRTPMNAIIGMTELVLGTELYGSQRDYLRMVLESGESLLEILNEILDFSKIEAGKLELELLDFHVWDMVGDAVKSLAVRAHSKGLELACHISPSTPEVLVGDAGRLRQAIMNLLGNAIKFTEQGEVLVDISCVKQGPDGALIRFSVADTGIGVPPDKQKHIFDAFTQADSSTTRRFGGTGLGLAIASRIVSMMGGELELESEVGVGSRFSFEVWLGYSKSLPWQRASAPTDRVKDVRVLIVDDNATNRNILEEMTRSWNMRPLTASSASEALQKLQEQADAGAPVELVLTDVHMPLVDGFTLIEQIRASGQYRELPVIVLSSGAKSAEADRQKRLAIAAYLMKPVKQSEVLTAIQSALAIQPRSTTRPVEEFDASAFKLPPLRILLAEDGLTNQKLAVGLLTRWGHQVSVANNGLEAVHAFESQPFDLILMDVQMPEMDGLEATACIRKLEDGKEQHVPIIALTARAMKGDRENCLAAGMDDYVSKPIRQRDIYNAMAPFFTQTQNSAVEVAWEAVLAKIDNDEQMLVDIIDCFSQEGPRLLAELEKGLQNSDAELVRRAVHTLKSSLQIFGVQATADLAGRIEKLARDNNLPEAGTLTETFQQQVQSLLAALKQYPSSQQEE